MALGEIARGIRLMTERKSPWGNGGNAGDKAPESGGVPPGEPAPPSGEAESADGAAAEAAEGETPPAETPSSEAPPPRGARSPWNTRRDAPPRRPASIEDIFRGRPPSDGPGAPAGSRPTAGGLLGSGGAFRLPPRANGKSWAPLLLGGFVALWLISSSTHQLGSTEQGIVTTFGKYASTIGPGVSLTLPWPIQTVEVTDVTSIRRDSIPDGEAEKLMLTSDQNLVDFSYLVRWNIKNLKLYTFQLDDPDNTVREVAEAAMRASVSEVPLNDVMGGAGRSEIEQAVRARMQAILDAYHSGVLIQGVDIKKADPPEKVVAAFQQVTVAQQGAQRDMSNAQAFAQQVIARAQGDAASFDKVYAQYKLAPEVTRRRMYYETMERVLSNNDKVIMEGNTTSSLPLPEARRRGPSVDVGPGTSGGQ